MLEVLRHSGAGSRRRESLRQASLETAIAAAEWRMNNGASAISTQQDRNELPGQYEATILGFPYDDFIQPPCGSPTPTL